MSVISSSNLISSEKLANSDNKSSSPSSSTKSSPKPSPKLQTKQNHNYLSTSYNAKDTCAVNSENLLTCKEGSIGQLSTSSSTDLSPQPEIKPELLSKDKKDFRARKKPWFYPFYPTYKSRSDEFKKIFADVPTDERLVVDYSCALQKEILHHGRLYVTQNYICFYANIFTWETNITIKWKDVTAITKEKTALIIPNAVLISTRTDKYFLTSFVQRDKTYLQLFRFWQNALMDQQMAPQEIWQCVHQLYGSELGLTSDDEDYIAPSIPEDDKLSTPLALESFSENCRRPESTMDQNNEEKHDNDTTQQDAHLPQQIVNQNGHSDTDDEPITMKDPDVIDIKCSNSHEGRVLLNEVLPIHVDQLFTLLFTSSKFYLDFHAMRKTTDLTQTPWTHNPLDNSKSRVVNMTYALGQTIGPKTSQVTERQTMLPCSKTGNFYSIDVESVNAGVPYADSFYVQLHWCIKKISNNNTSVTVYAQLLFKKNVWGIVKSMIDKNVWSGLEEFYASLKEALLLEEEEYIPEQRRKSRRKKRMHSIHSYSLEDVKLSVPRRKYTQSKNVFSTDICTLLVFSILLILLVINGLLYYKLWHLEETPSYRFFDKYNEKTLPKSHDGWIKILQQQESIHTIEAQKWQKTMRIVVQLLKEAEQSLNELQKSIQPNPMDQLIAAVQDETTEKTEIKTEL